MSYNLNKKEDWEKDFSGLEKLCVIHEAFLSDYEQAAKKCKIRMEYKNLKNGAIHIFTPHDQDLTDFWKETEKLRRESNAN